MTGRNDLLVPVRLETASRRYAGHLGESDPTIQKFVPFTLGGGDGRWIVIRTSFGNCAPFAPHSFETFTRFAVTYTALGFTKHVWVSLPKDLRVDSPPDAACPARAG
jgi:hypothetical protein